MGELLRRIHYLINRQRRLDAELQDDMDFHRGEWLRARGRITLATPCGCASRPMKPAELDIDSDRLLQDLRYGVRILVRAPGFTLMAVLVLAIGIGVNVSAHSSLFLMIALKPLPHSRAERIVRLERRSPTNYFERNGISIVSLLSRACQDTLCNHGSARRPADADR